MPMAGIVARISGCVNQREMSLEDQIDHAKEIVSEVYPGPVEFRTIATKGKGERLDRPELEDIKKIIQEGKLDLLVMEDMGRLVRGHEAVRLFGMAVDHGIRAISPNDNVDTANPTWEEDALAACRDHVAHNAHTSKRIKQKLMNRFMKFGGAIAREIYGYIVPDSAKVYDEWQIDPSATPMIREGLRLLRQTLNCGAVADFFNVNKVPVGPYCRRKSWDGTMIRRFYANRLLGGMVGRGFKHTVKHHETGRRIARKNPDGPHFRHHPSLAHVDIAELDEVNLLLAERNKTRGRKLVNGSDPKFNVPRTRTPWPAQGGSQCWYCGRHHLRGANGMTDHLMCAGSRDRRCWNSFGFDGTLAANKVAEAIATEVCQLDTFDHQFRELIQTSYENDGDGIGQQLQSLQRKEAAFLAQKEKVKSAIMTFGDSAIVHELMEDLEKKEVELNLERRRLEQRACKKLILPESTAKLKEIFLSTLQKLSVESIEGAHFLRKIVTQFQVYLVRLCDGGHLLPRARVKLSLDGIVEDAKEVSGLPELLSRELTIDLFHPPQRERIREQAVALAEQGLGPKAIGVRIAEHPAQAAVQRALALHRKMLSLGLNSPYIVLQSPPDNYAKLRRFKSVRYRFEPLPGYVQSPL